MQCNGKMRSIFTEKMIMSKWVDYQSIISISIALNAAYFSIASFVSPYALNQKRLIEKALEGLLELSEENECKKIRKKLVNLGHDLGTQEELDKHHLSRFRPLSVILFIAGMVLLWVASVKADIQADNWIAIVSPALSLPFTIGILYMSIKSSGKYKDITRRRREIEKCMSRAISSKKQSSLENE